MSWLARALDENTPVPWLLSTAIIAFFLLDALLSRRRRPVGSPTVWFGSSNLFLFASLAALGLLGTFCLLHVSVLGSSIGLTGNPYFQLAAMLNCTWATGFLVAVAIRLRIKRLRFLFN